MEQSYESQQMGSNNWTESNQSTDMKQTIINEPTYINQPIDDMKQIMVNEPKNSITEKFKNTDNNKNIKIFLLIILYQEVQLEGK